MLMKQVILIVELVEKHVSRLLIWMEGGVGTSPRLFKEPIPKGHAL